MKQKNSKMKNRNEQTWINFPMRTLHNFHLYLRKYLRQCANLKFQIDSFYFAFEQIEREKFIEFQSIFTHSHSVFSITNTHTLSLIETNWKLKLKTREKIISVVEEHTNVYPIAITCKYRLNSKIKWTILSNLAVRWSIIF